MSHMGSSKNKSPAQAEKSQLCGITTKEKNQRMTENSSVAPKAEIVVILTEEQAQKLPNTASAKVITSSEVAKQCILPFA